MIVRVLGLVVLVFGAVARLDFYNLKEGSVGSGGAAPGAPIRRR